MSVDLELQNEESSDFLMLKGRAANFPQRAPCEAFA